MESAKGKVRMVPEDRIKTLRSSTMFWGGNEEFERQRIIEDIGYELAKKLVEFHKLEVRDGLLLSRLEIIIPPTPESQWPPKDK